MELLLTFIVKPQEIALEMMPFPFSLIHSLSSLILRIPELVLLLLELLEPLGVFTILVPLTLPSVPAWTVKLHFI